jgi:hypothetical protein
MRFIPGRVMLSAMLRLRSGVFAMLGENGGGVATERNAQRDKQGFCVWKRHSGSFVFQALPVVMYIHSQRMLCQGSDIVREARLRRLYGMRAGVQAKEMSFGKFIMYR